MRERSPGLSPKEKRRHLPPGRRLTPDEILSRTVSPINGDPIISRAYTTKNIIGVDLGGVTCLLVDIDHDLLEPEALNLISSPKVKKVVAEYFLPDLERSSIVDTNSVARSFAEQAGGRLAFAEQLAQNLRALEKDVIVADIANKPLYEYYKALRVGLAGFTTLTTATFGLAGLPIPAAISAATSIHNWIVEYQEKKGNGMFNEEKITKSEKLLFDIEEVRRIFVSKGLEQLAHNMRESGQEDGIIVALYPRAHGLRIADMLEHPGKRSNTLKGGLAKAVTPGLEYTLREYEYGSSNDEEENDWNLKEIQKIRTASIRPTNRRLLH